MNRIRYYRVMRGLTLRDLGKLSGVDASTIFRIEDGQVEGRVNTLYKIATALGVSPFDIKGEIDPNLEGRGLARAS